MHANFWPDTALIDLVITMHTDNTVLFDRYTERKYSQRKIEENIDCEIVNMIGSENREYFGGMDEDGERTIPEEELTTAVVELQGDTEEDLKDNLRRLVEWVKKWQERRKEWENEEEPERTRVEFDQDP